MARSGQSIRSAGHVLTPNTARRLVNQFSTYQNLDHETSSDHSESPDSIYSPEVPFHPDQAFEYDHDQDLDEVERDEDDYESIMGVHEGREDGMRRWPENGIDSHDWTPSPRSILGGLNGGRKGSIISISPRGSFSHSTKEPSSRRPSTPGNLAHDPRRRSSNPSLLGFDLAQKRSNSLNVLPRDQRRRSSNASNASIDLLEDARLRNIASLEGLGRRFSEVVQVTRTSQDAGSTHDDTRLARLALHQSPWSTDLDTEDEEDSEIQTASYVPTPDVDARRPALLSNYPLPSAVRESNTPFTPQDYPSPNSPFLSGRSYSQPTGLLFATPPPPAQPSDIVRGRSRPGLPRALTEYQFPPRSAGVPAGAGPPRPSLQRAVSVPHMSEGQAVQPIDIPTGHRIAGISPISRTIPLGISPSRSSLRRQSITSDMDRMRRESQSTVGSRPLFEHPRRMSEEVKGTSLDSRRGSIVAERRMSIVNGTSLPRRQSEISRSTNESRKASLAPSIESRRGSSSSFNFRKESISSSRKGSFDMRRDLSSSSRMSNSSRKDSVASRKSSVMSIGEYGYLAPEIVVDEPTPAVPSESTFGNALPVEGEAVPVFRRSNAPTSITLPVRGLRITSAPITPSGSSRFNPLEEFLGIAPLTPSTGGTITPDPGALWTPRAQPAPVTSDITLPPTPKTPNGKIMDRPRPISPPHFLESFPFKSRNSPYSPKAARFSSSGSETVCASENDSAPSSTETFVAEPPVDRSPKQAGNRLSVVRKAVPTLSAEELKELEKEEASERHEVPNLTRNYLRRGAVELFTPNDSTLPRPPIVHRRTTSIGPRDYTYHDAVRPVVKRHSTNPADFAFPTPPPPRRPPRGAYPGQQKKSPSVRFSPELNDKPNPPLPVPSTVKRTVSNSSFSRFFSKTKPNSPLPSPKSKPLKSALRPASMDYASVSGSEKSLVEIKEMLRLGGTPEVYHSRERGKEQHYSKVFI